MARPSTVADAIVQVARNLSLVDGVGMQPYSEDQITGYLVGAHQFIVDEQEWPDLTIEHVRTLDGTTGKITQLITEITDWKRILRLYHESSNHPLPYRSSYNNPLVNTFPYGYRGLSIPEDTQTGGKYLVAVYPLTLSGQVLFQSQLDFDLSDPTVVIPIDWWLHVYHASWQYAADDGTNEVQIDKYMNLFNSRMKQVKSKNNARPVAMDPQNTIPNQWTEFDAP